MPDRINRWLKSHQHVAVWTTLCACLVALYEISKLT